MQGKDTDRWKMDDRDYSVRCLQCGQTFEAKRSDATFCSARCRVSYSREPQKLLNAIEEMRSMGYRTRDISGKYSTNKQVYETLMHLQSQVRIALQNMETAMQFSPVGEGG
jgi:protein-arginine kinase activator protein McsA